MVNPQTFTPVKTGWSRPWPSATRPITLSMSSSAKLTILRSRAKLMTSTMLSCSSTSLERLHSQASWHYRWGDSFCHCCLRALEICHSWSWSSWIRLLKNVVPMTSLKKILDYHKNLPEAMMTHRFSTLKQDQCSLFQHRWDTSPSLIIHKFCML